MKFFEKILKSKKNKEEYSKELNEDDNKKEKKQDNNENVNKENNKKQANEEIVQTTSNSKDKQSDESKDQSKKESENSLKSETQQNSTNNKQSDESKDEQTSNQESSNGKESDDKSSKDQQTSNQESSSGKASDNKNQDSNISKDQQTSNQESSSGKESDNNKKDSKKSKEQQTTNQDKGNQNQNNNQQSDEDSPNDYVEKKVFSSVEENIKYLKKIQNESFDLVTREMTLVNNYQSLKVGLAYYAGLVDQNLLNRAIGVSFSNNFQNMKRVLKTKDDRFNYFKDTLITVIGVDDADKYGKLFNTLISGDMILFIEGVDKCIIIGARLYQERSVDKPTTQMSVKGSNDSFNENLLTDISLIRRRIKNPNLWVKNYIVGKESNSNMALLYINGLANENIVNEAKSRIESMKPENIIDSSYIQSYLKEKQFSIFPRMYSTERPDTAVSNLLEGRLVLLIDASPYALIIPAVFIQFIQSPEDFYQATVVSNFFRIIRFISLILAITLPGLYISAILHHSELLPINLLFSVAGQRIQVPLPSYIELLLIMFAFDLLREAGTRMPNALGSTLSFVGAIIIGQSAVEAGLISPIIVIVIALAGISSLTIPNYDLNLTVTILRYIFTIFAIIFGLYGLTVCYILTIIHLTSLRSFGVDYFAPFAPFSKSGLKDSVIRSPLSKLFKRKLKSSGQFPH